MSHSPHPRPLHPTLPPAAFVDPAGGNREEVREALVAAVELVLDHLARAADRPPMPRAGAVALPEPLLPDAPSTLDAVLDALAPLLDGAMNPASPRYLGHMDSVPTVASIVGDLVAAAVNNDMLSAELSPSFTRLEWELLRDLALRFGLGPAAGGVLTAGGSLANLHALAVARNVAFDVMTDGNSAIPGRPVLLASVDAHISLRKAAMLLGLGTGAVVPVATDARGRMDVAALRRAVGHARARGDLPFAVVATAGTTVLGVVDPLAGVAEVAAEHGLWLHVDASYAGALVLAERHRHLLAGIERADSVTWNPEKWLYVAKTCAMTLFRDMEAMERVFRVRAPYVREERALPNLGEIGVEGTRHADVVKLWLSLRHLGASGYDALLDAGLTLTRAFVERVAARPWLSLAGPPELNLVCFRGTPGWVPEEAWDAWNARLQHTLQREGTAFFSLPRYRGALWIRGVLLNPATTPATLDAIFERIDHYAEASRAAGG